MTDQPHLPDKPIDLVTMRERKQASRARHPAMLPLQRLRDLPPSILIIKAAAAVEDRNLATALRELATRLAEE
jgi:hypothetical protein